MNRLTSTAHSRVRVFTLAFALIVSTLLMARTSSHTFEASSDPPLRSATYRSPSNAFLPTTEQLNAIVRGESRAVVESLSADRSFYSQEQQRFVSEPVGLERLKQQRTAATRSRRVVDGHFQGDPARYYAGELMIRVHADAAPAQIQNALTAAGLSVIDSIPSIGVYQLLGPENLDVPATVAALVKTGLFEMAEPNYAASVSLVPNDPAYGSQWAHPMIGSEAFWDSSLNTSTLVAAVIDTGVDLDHPEFAGRIVAGYDYVNSDSVPDDDHGHGTHVAGIIGAAGNNGQGVAGLVWNAKIMPLKVMDDSGSGSYSDMAKGIIFAADNGATVINMSLAGTSASSTLQSAVTYAWQRGVMVFAAAGNSGSETLIYPAACDHAIGVGATDSSDNVASYSTTGSHVDLSAPGSSIMSTFSGGTYVTWSGTSMATPYAAGVGLVVAAAFPGIAPDAAEQIIKDAAIDRGTPGWDKEFGYGRVDLAGILATLPGESTPPPIAVTDLVVTQPSALIDIAQPSWSRSSSHQGSSEVSGVTDGNSATFWSSAGSTTNRAEWLVLDYGQPREVNTLKVRRGTDLSIPLPAQIQVLAGDHDGHWTNLLSIANPTKGDTGWVTWTFPSMATRYLALWMPSLNTDALGMYRTGLGDMQASWVHDNSGTEAVVGWSWSASNGVVNSFDLRGSTTPITAANFLNATQIASVPPVDPYTSYSVSGLSPAATYYFAVRSLNDSGVSAMSNVAIHTTSGSVDTVAPSPINDLAGTAGEGPVQMLPAPTAVFATSWYSSATRPEMSHDGNIYTGWATVMSPTPRVDHIKYDLGATYPVSLVRMEPLVLAPTFFPVDFEIWTSADNLTWELVRTVTGKTITNKYVWVDYTFPVVTARYVGIRVLRGMVEPISGQYVAAIGDLQVGQSSTTATNSVTLSFSAVGDDGMAGRAHRYEVVQSQMPLNGGSATEAVLAGGLPTPLAANTPQQITVNGLKPGLTYYFGVRVYDEAGNGSSQSTVSVTTVR